MAAENLHNLLEYFGQEQACYTALLNLSHRQREIIETGNVDELLKVLGQKQQILGHVATIEQKLLPFKREWASLRRSLHEDDRQVLQIALSTVEELLRELIETEQQSEQLLTQQRDHGLAALNESVRGQTVHHAYAAPAHAPSPSVLDIRSQ